MGRYRTIVVDPPWELNWSAKRNEEGFAFGSRRGSLPYGTMTLAEISALPVLGLAEPNAHLYLWTVNAYVEQAYGIARAWGFKPSTLLVWCKSPKGRGLGGRFSTATEYVLFSQRGSFLSDARCDRNWWQWKRGAHSVKPDAFLDIVEQVSPGPYLELFARRSRLGWDCWGDEAPNPIEWDMAAA